MIRRPARALTVAALALALMTGCDAGGDGVDQAKLQDDMKAHLNDQKATDSPVSTVACPHGLKAEVGDAVTCQATLENGKTMDVEAKVTSVDGSTIRYSMRPKPAGATSVEG